MAKTCTNCNIAVTVDPATNVLDCGTVDHQLVANQWVSFRALNGPHPEMPAGMTAGTHYYVCADGLMRCSFKISATPGGAVLNIMSAGLGVVLDCAGA